MSNLKFADTHNMVAFLSNPTECEGFEQIVDFLNAHQIKINGETQIHALVDGKKVVVTESTIRRDLQLGDEEGVDCLPNATIFEQLTLMGLKTSAWNEFNSTMASAIICLATNQKFNFSKFIFEGMLRNLDNVASKILMYPRFVQIFVNQQVEGMPTHKRKYDAPCHIKKVFGNMKRVGKGFLGNVTPLFPTMVVQNQAQPSTITQTSTPTTTNIPTSTQTPTIIQPTPSQPQKQQLRKPKRKVTEVPQPSEPIHVADEAVRKELGDRLVRAATTASSLEAEQDSEKGQEARKEQEVKILQDLGKDASKQGRINDIDVDANITLVSLFVDEDDVEMFDKDEDVALNAAKDGVNENEEVVEEVIEAINTAKLIVDAAKVSVVGVQVSAADVTKTVSAALSTIAATTVEEVTLAQTVQKMKTQPQDKGKAKMIEPVKMKDQIRLDEETVIRLQAEFDEEERLAKEEAQNIKKANIALIKEWDNIQTKIDTDYQLAERLQTEEQEELSIDERAKLFQQLLETRRRHFAKKRAEEKRNKPPTQAQQRRIINEKGEALEQENTKKQKVDEDKSTTELQSLMEVIPDEEEVAIDAIPLATKEDLEDLYKLVRAKYKSTTPVEDLDLVLWNDLKNMFEPNVEDKVWKLQQRYSVVS
ncbi:hypothetical protein Tco_0608594 [Tanacetum coccineum]